MEDLRQMCIYRQVYHKGANGRQKFWDYIKKVHDECEEGINEDCSKYGHKEVDVDWERTMECVQDSFSTPNKAEWVDKSTKNSFIDTDVEYWAKYGSNLFPSIVINNSTYRGQLETNAVFNAICAGFP